MKKVISFLLTVGMLFTMAASGCFAKGVAENAPDCEVVYESSEKSVGRGLASNDGAVGDADAKVVELSQKEVDATDVYFKNLAEKSGKPESSAQTKFDEFKEKLGKAYKERVGKEASFYIVDIGDGPCKL